MRICRWLGLVVLLGELPAGQTFAIGGGAFVLGPGEAKAVDIGSTYREIRVCNDLESAGDLIVAFPDHDPVRLAPGICKSGHGDHIPLRNDSKSIVFCIVQVIGKHQS